MSIKFSRTENPLISKDGWRVEMEVPNGTEIETIVDTFRLFLLGLSYHPNTVKENVPSYQDVFGDKQAKRGYEVGDRVRYYGAFNSDSEVSTGTVKSTEDGSGIVEVELDYYCDNDGGLRKGPCTQSAHVKQLRRLKAKQ